MNLKQSSIDPIAFIEAFFEVLGNPDVHWRPKPVHEFLNALAEQMAVNSMIEEQNGE